MWGGGGVCDLFGNDYPNQGTSPKITRKTRELKRRSNALERRCPLKTCNLCVDVAPCRHVGQDTGGFPRKGGYGWRGGGVGGGNNTSAKNNHRFPLRLVECWLTLMLLNLWDTSVPDVLYTFLVTNITCLTSEQQPSLDGGISAMFHASTQQQQQQHGGRLVRRPVMQKTYTNI